MWVCKCFLSFIHLLLYIRWIIVILFDEIRSYFSISSRTCTHGNIRNDSLNLMKLPRHISFMVLESDISFVDLAQLIVWSMAMGIPYISVYDREAPTQVCISLLSEQDGKGDIVDAAREFCKGVQLKHRTPKEMEPDIFNGILKATCGIPDPELALKFGDAQLIMGFLPWQTRLTEFQPLRSHVNIKYSTFLSSLTKYGTCQQRFGK
ncbi:dehydrodolichyl diphosphate synthase complex subunit Nus1-like isoform X2 [Stylophora pistillata]|uniref:dehydrodolichyl diphosphate synthase complex subunit Nus1-like isoform X2 n=1 Tax=Stylophora pistillata TaxID=50429 RepID=UPI000C03DC67|nr:dehydrodolichyl diphosphate synthase complex subunit Nus1-like isoform X2 [Stylophora pistillata]